MMTYAVHFWINDASGGVMGSIYGHVNRDIPSYTVEPHILSLRYSFSLVLGATNFLEAV